MRNVALVLSVPVVNLFLKSDFSFLKLSAISKLCSRKVVYVHGVQFHLILLIKIL